jgi:hypothetical protein
VRPYGPLRHVPRTPAGQLLPEHLKKPTSAYRVSAAHHTASTAPPSADPHWPFVGLERADGSLDDSQMRLATRPRWCVIPTQHKGKLCLFFYGGLDAQAIGHLRTAKLARGFPFPGGDLALCLARLPTSGPSTSAPTIAMSPLRRSPMPIALQEEDICVCVTA